MKLVVKNNLNQDLEISLDLIKKLSMKYLNKIILIICLLFTNTNLFSQYQFNYLYEFKQDSVSKKKHTDYMNVIVDGDQRIYRSEKRIINDSIGYTNGTVNNNNISTFMSTTKDIRSSVDNYTLEIDLNKSQEKHYVYNLELPFWYEKKLELPIWNISNEVIEFEGKKVKKATTHYLSRNWTAYFSEEIPIQAAPYLFYGLPGAIIKLEDQYGNYKFELISYKSKKDFSNIYKTMISRRRTDFVKMNAKEMYELGKNLQQNMTNILMASGLQLTEDEVKKRQENYKKRVHIYLNPSIPFIL